MCPRKSVPDPEPTQERSRSQLSRNGVMFLLRNLVWLKFFATKILVYIQYNVFHCHERCIEASTCIFILTNCILQNHLKIKTFGLVQFMIDCQYIKQWSNEIKCIQNNDKQGFYFTVMSKSFNNYMYHSKGLTEVFFNNLFPQFSNHFKFTFNNTNGTRNLQV